MLVDLTFQSVNLGVLISDHMKLILTHQSYVTHFFLTGILIETYFQSVDQYENVG